jgi:iron complex transport system ATP-binding protein
MAVLECRGVSCGYDHKTVLHDISFSVEPGESIVLLGPNGSGKSTLLKACCKTHPYRQGELKLGGEEVRALTHEEVAKRAAFVPQEELIPFPFLVRDVVTMGRLSRSKGLFDSPDDFAAATSAMEFTDCVDLAERPVTELSGGERQRVLIARAIAQGAPLMLLDEPTSHLDVAHQMSLAKLLRRMAREGTAVVTAIHDLNMASLLADRAILLHDGGIAEDGPVEQVLRSAALDKTYSVEFDRVELAGSRLLVFAR